MSDYCNADCATRLALATADRTSAKVLQRLATDPEAEVRRAVASNPNTPKDALLQLGEEFPDAIVANPIFNILLIENPEDRFVRLSLARSSTTSVQTLANLAQLANEEVSPTSGFSDPTSRSRRSAGITMSAVLTSPSIAVLAEFEISDD